MTSITPQPAARIMWVSRHAPTKRQLAALEALFPSHTLIIDEHPFDGADDLLTRYHGVYHATEMVVVAPDAVIRAIIKRGITPIKAEMKQVPCDSPDTEVRLRNGRCYAFVRFSRIARLDYQLHPLSPPCPQCGSVGFHKMSCTATTKEESKCT